MAPSLDLERLNYIFQSRPDIVEAIKINADTVGRVNLFNHIATHVHDQLTEEPASKRRKLDGASLPVGGPHQVASANGAAATNGRAAAASSGSADDLAATAAAEQVQLELKDISVAMPQRKKYDICFTKKYLYARTAGTTAPVQGLVYPWKDIEYAFFLPVPEKSQLQYNYVFFPRGTSLPPSAISSTKASASGEASSSTTPSQPAAEPLVLTIAGAGAQATPKPGSVGGSLAGRAAAVADTYASLLHWAFQQHLQGAGSSVKIESSDPARFKSKIRQPHRPQESAVHVKAFRGSKDGYLFFLEAGLLWGFKKPLLFFPLDRVAAVSYTSVLQRTFNVAVEAFADDPDDRERTVEVEFAMLDQEDYGPIDEAWVRRHGLQDRSMAERRRAKKELAENARAKKEAGEEGDDGFVDDANGAAAGATAGAPGAEDDEFAGMTELEKAHALAERQAQDDEDEDEEDYDPGSDGLSDGSGESSEEDDSDDDGGGEGGEEGDEEGEDEEEGDEGEEE